MKITTKTAHMRTTRKGFTLVELLVVIAIIAALAGVSYGPIMRQINAADRSEATSNGRSIFVGLLGYYTKFGEFPREDVTTAEDAFNVLISAGEIEDEKYFWNKANAKQDFASLDGVDNDGDIVASENVWGFVMDLDATDGTSTILFDACNSATAGGTGDFNTGVWSGQAIIVRADGSVSAEKIDYDGKPLEDDGTAKSGPITEQRGGDDAADIFAAVPDSSEVFVTSN